MAVVPKVELQLVGITSLFISSKYEEIYGPNIYDLEHIAANTYTRSQILAMEKTILQVLDYRLLKPYPINFLRRFSRLLATDMSVHHLAKYFIDLSLLIPTGSTLLPSKKAASSLVLAASLVYCRIPKDIWNSRLCLHSGYSTTELTPTLKTMLLNVQAMHGTNKAKALCEKYIHRAPSELAKHFLSKEDLKFPKVKV